MRVFIAGGSASEEFVFVQVNRVDNGTTLSAVARQRLADRSCFILHLIYVKNAQTSQRDTAV